MQENICIRCGKTRIFARRWKEKVDGRGTVVTHEETVCPDSACQKVVDEQFLEMRNKRIRLEDAKQSIRLSRKASKNT